MFLFIYSPNNYRDLSFCPLKLTTLSLCLLAQLTWFCFIYIVPQILPLFMLETMTGISARRVKTQNLTCVDYILLAVIYVGKSNLKCL
jgi:hypothetical protein